LLKKTRRLITINDCIKLKKLQPFDTWRNAAKSENFGLMFGAQASTFRKLLQKSSFSVKDCDDYIRLTHSEDVYEQVKYRRDFKKAFAREYEMRDDVECKFQAVAEVMREAFLKGYTGLAERIEREHTFAIKHYYTRMWYGSVRHHPELAYMTIDPLTNRLRKGSVDQRYSSLMFSHLMNNAANAAVQAGETVFIYAGWINADERMQLWNLTSKIFNTIHDSLDVYVWKPEKELMKSLINACVHDKIRFPYEGVRHRMEPEISDIRDYKHLTGYDVDEFQDVALKLNGKDIKIKGHFYKHGEEEKVLPIQDAIDQYNKRMHRDIKWKEMEF